MVKLSNGTEENIKVIIRIKPNSGHKHETIISNDGQPNCISVPDKAIYTFDKVAHEDTTQEDMFESLKTLFQSFIDGYNATIFAYGQTGSGKTFTMSGDSDGVGSTHNPGLIPRGLSFIFDKINERSLSNEVEYLVKCSFVEIYNEQIYDLLDHQMQRLNIRINVSNEAYLEQCTELIMENPKMAGEILKRGMLNRHMASTEMNRESSRSHAVFTIVLESRQTEGDVACVKKSCLHLVDLAGSERQRDSKTEGIRLKEAGMINKSLLALSMVIRKLADASKCAKVPFIAYRDSKLTLLLKDAIGGNSKTSLVACIHNDIRFVAETWSTLQFASSVKMIKNSAKINEDIHGDNESLRNEIGRLRQQLADYKMPRTIQTDEFDSDFVWKKRFVTAMLLRSALNLDVAVLNERVATSNTVIHDLEKANDTIKMELDLQEKKLKKLENKLLVNSADIPDEDNLSALLNATLAQLKDQRLVMTEHVKSNQLQIQVQYYANELIKLKNLNSLTVSDQSLIHSLMKDFNSLIEDNSVQELAQDVSGKDVEMAQLKQDLAQLRSKYSSLMSTVKSINIARRDERRQLEGTIAAMRYRLKITDEQRETARNDRRQTLLTVQQGCSPIRRHHSQNKHNKLMDISGEEEFISAEEYFKQNDEYLSHWNKVSGLENDVMTKQTQIGTLEYNITEYKKEVEELRRSLCSKTKLEKDFDAIKEKYNSANMALLEANEAVKKLEKENVALEASKDKTIKIFSEKTFSLEEELKNMEMEKEMYRDASERMTMSMVCCKNEVQRLQETLAVMEKDNSHLDSIIKSLNSKISENYSVFEEIADAKQELLNTQAELRQAAEMTEEYKTQNGNLQRRVDELSANDHGMRVTVLELEEEIRGLLGDNTNLAEANEELQNIELELQIEMTAKNTEYRDKVCDLETRLKDTEFELNCKVEEKECKLVELLDEVESLKNQIEEFEKENSDIKSLQKSLLDNQGSSGVPLFLTSPLNNSSPVARKPLGVLNNNRSLIDDLMVSKDRSDQALKEDHDRLAVIHDVVDRIFTDILRLPLSSSVVDNMATIEARLGDHQHELEDLVINKLVVEERLRAKTEECDDTLKVLKATEEQREEYRTLFNDLANVVTELDPMDTVEKMKFLVSIKEDHMKLRQENIQLMEEKYRIRMWLHEHGYLRLFESCAIEGDTNHYLFTSR